MTAPRPIRVEPLPAGSSARPPEPEPAGLDETDRLWRRRVEVVSLLALWVVALGVGLVTGSAGWGLIVAGVLTAAHVLVIVDTSRQPVHTGSARERG